MGGEERVERQHASGRLTVRERIERLFDEGTFHETGALAGRGTYGDDGELSEFLPANTVVGQGRIDGRRAVVEGDDFTVRGGAADAAIWEKTALRRAHGARPPAPARPARGRHGRRGQRQVARGHGLLVRAAAARLRPRREEPVDRAGRRRGARPGRRARRRARGVLALLRDREGHRAAVRGRTAGRGDGGHGRDARQGGAGRRADAGARRRGGQRGGRRGRRARPAQAVPLLPPAERLGGAAGRGLERPARPPRGGARLHRPARPAQRVQDAPHPRGRARPRLGVRARRRLRPPHDHVPRAPRRAPRRACWRRIPSTTAAASPRTPPRRPLASWTCATSSTCRS